MESGTLTRDDPERAASPAHAESRAERPVPGAVRERLASWFRESTGPLAVATGLSIPISTTLTEIVLAVLGVCWLLGGRLNQRIQTVLGNPVARCTLALFAVYALTLLYTTALMPEAARMLLKHRPLLYIAVFVTIFVDGRLRRKGLRAFECSMLLTLGAAFLISVGLFEAPRGGPGTGAVFKNHIAQNVMMAFLVFLLAHRCLDAPRWRWLYGLLALLAAYNVLFMVAGRTGHVALAALVLLFLFQRMTRWSLVLGTAAALLAAVASYSTSANLRHRLDLAVAEFSAYTAFRTAGGVPRNARSIPEARDTSIGRRLSFYEGSLSIARNHLVFGTGVGSFRKEYGLLAAENGLPPSANPHSEYLLALVQAGLPALALLLALFATQWIVSYRLDAPMKWTLQGIVAIYAMNCMFNSMLFDTTEGHFFAYMTGLCAGGLAAARAPVARNGDEAPAESRETAEPVIRAAA